LGAASTASSVGSQVAGSEIDWLPVIAHLLLRMINWSEFLAELRDEIWIASSTFDQQLQICFAVLWRESALHRMCTITTYDALDRCLYWCGMTLRDKH